MNCKKFGIKQNYICIAIIVILLIFNTETISAYTSNQNGNSYTVSKVEISTYKKALDISPNDSVRTEVVSRLMHRKRTNIFIYNKIVYLSKLLDKKDDREAAANEFVNMNEEFVDRFHDSAPKRTQQIRKYLLFARDRSKIRINLRRSKILDLFNKRIGTDEFIRQIWD